MTTLTIDGKPYEFSFVCKPTDAGSTSSSCCSTPSGEHAYGALGGKDNDPAFFGSPTQAEQEAMAKAVKN